MNGKPRDVSRFALKALFGILGVVSGCLSLYLLFNVGDLHKYFGLDRYASLIVLVIVFLISLGATYALGLRRVHKMDAKEHLPQHPGGGNLDWGSDVSKWWYLLAFPAVMAGLVLLDLALDRLLGSPESVFFFLAGVLASAGTSATQEPKTIRQALTTTAIITAAGALAMMGYAVTVLLSDMIPIRLLGLGVSVGMTTVWGRMVCRRLSVPQRHT